MIVRNQPQQTSSPLTYTNSFSDTTTTAVTATQIFSPAANVNGAYVEYIGFSGVVSGSGGTNATILAKSAAPTNANDGDVVFRVSTGAGNASATQLFPQVSVQQAQRIKIPAGKGLYLNQTINNSAASLICEKTVLYTLL